MSYNHDARAKTLADGSQREYVRNIYRCTRKLNDKAACTGQYSYTAEPIKEKVLRVVRRFLDNVGSTPAEDMIAAATIQKGGVQKVALKSAEDDLWRAKQGLDALEDEALKAVTGSSQLDLSVVNKLIQKQEAALEVAQLTYDSLVDEVQMKAEHQAYKEAEVSMVKSWAETFDAMELDAKRTVLAAMIDRVEVSPDYKLVIRFSLTMRQFLGEVAAAVAA